MSLAADVLRFSELYSGTIPSFTVGQLPHVAAESWGALPQKPGVPRRGQVSLFLVGTPPPFDKPVSGLIFDEWNETIPSAKETTGLAFHFDRPNSRAPHAILLAVAPDVTRPWNLLFLEQLLREAFQLSKARLVDQDAMTELDHYLPALTFAMNAAGDTVSTDLRFDNHAFRHQLDEARAAQPPRFDRRGPGSACLRSAVASRATVAVERVQG
jgi:hypothetical protein